MRAPFRFELVSPERVLLSTDSAEEAVVPGADGEFTVYSGHAPVVTTLNAGTVRVTTKQDVKEIFIDGGFAEVDPKSLTILAERAFLTDAVDVRQIDDTIAAVEKSLLKADSDEARAHLARAIDQLKLIQARRRDW
jgi:F-type H+-transporting ATPase subunit epsilon